MPGGGNLLRSPRYRKKPRVSQSAHARYYYTRSLVLESNKARSPNSSIPRCQSAPRVMDSNSRSASPRDMTAARPQHRPPSPPPSTPPAFDNRAYQHDEDHNHNDSFTSQQQNGHTKDQPNGTQTKTPEAVNLELINLTPKNGSKRKDVEVDMNASNPYDEYFVPVNEHRKYMRGEKLYVTADKRGEKGGCKRPLCWTMLALVAAAVIALIVLAATGVLFSAAPTPLMDPFNSSSVSSARAFSGIGAHDHNVPNHDHMSPDHDHSSPDHDHSSHDHDHSSHDHNHSSHDHDHSSHDQDHSDESLDGHNKDQSDQQHPDHEHIEPIPTSEPSTKEHNEMPTTQTKLDVPASDESSEIAMFVPRALEGELKIDNEVFTPELMDPESEEFRSFSSNFGNALKKALFDRDTLQNGNNKISVEVITIRPGSLIVTYRIHWAPKTSSEASDDLFTEKSLKQALDDYLERNSRMISVYHVAEDKMSTRQVLDLCHLNKNNCEYGCVFDETTLEFMCTCPRGQILDMENSKKCMSILGSTEDQSSVTPTNDPKQKGFRVLDITHETNTQQKQTPEEEKPKDNFEWKYSQESVTGTTTNPETDFKYLHDDSSEQPSNHDPNAEPEPTAEPEQRTEPETTQTKIKVGITSGSESEPTAQPEPEPSAQPEPEPPVQPEPEPSAQPEPEPSAQPEPEPSAQPEPEPSAQPEPEPSAEPEPEPSAQPEPEASAQPESFGKSEPSFKLEPEPSSDPEQILNSKPSADSTSIPEATTEPQLSQHSISIEIVTELEPTVEPETKSEDSQTKHGDKTETEPNLESTTNLESMEQGLSAAMEGHVIPEPSTEPEPTAEPHHAIEPEATTEIKPDSDITLSTKEYAMLTYGATSESDTAPKVNQLLNQKPVTEKDEYEMKPEIGISHELDQEQELITTMAPIAVNIDGKKSSMGSIQKQPKLLDDSTTIASSLSENTQNEPEEIKPDVFSIYDQVNSNVKPSNSNTDSQELNKTQENMPKNYMDFIYDNINDEKESSKSSNSKLPETTTASIITSPTHNITEHDEEISFDLITNQNANSGSIKKHAEHGNLVETTMPMAPIEEKRTIEIETNNTTKTNSTIDNNFEMSLKHNSKSDEINLETKTESNNNIKGQIESEFDKMLNMKEETAMINTSTMASAEKNTTVPIEILPSTESSKSTEFPPSIELAQDYSISKNEQPNKEIGLMEFLENKTKGTTTTPLPENSTTEVTDITFDNISTLFNRSSKSIEEITNATKHVPTETTTDSLLTTTTSDWLSETISEIYYKDMILESKADTHTTTDQPLTKTKIDEIINKGYNKDDFEPEYLNISPTRGPDQEPLYGMVNNDYDSEDFRVKRVNSMKESPVLAANSTSGETKLSEKTSNTVVENISNDTKSVIALGNTADKTSMVTVDGNSNIEVISNFSSPSTKTEDRATNISLTATNDQIESTTITQYIYKSTEHARDEPAPVWEEDEPVIKNITSPSLIYFKSGISTENSNNQETTTTNPAEEFHHKSETQLNNLNVTIYEISGRNHSFSTSNSTAHSSEYEDHETEMNPFLPEVENNKSLVKKLQEGHDLIEPVNVNETQSENPEEQNTHPSEMSTTTEGLERGSKANENESTLNELTNEDYNVDSPEVDTAVPITNSKTEVVQDKGSVSTFLQDTDDLDIKTNADQTTPKPTTEATEIASPVTSQASDDDSDYLSVVPIVEERREEKEALRKTYINGGIQKLNDISDSPKKSDRRTLDASKLDSVINNEA